MTERKAYMCNGLNKLFSPINFLEGSCIISYRLMWEEAFTFTQFGKERRRQLLNDAPSHKPCPACALKASAQAMDTPQFGASDALLYQGNAYHTWDFVYMERNSTTTDFSDPDGCFELNQIIELLPQAQQPRIRRFKRHTEDNTSIIECREVQDVRGAFFVGNQTSQPDLKEWLCIGAEAEISELRP
ncbi:hypothetical protein R3P38DRAFT_2758845 [Favolaschia claudopus]|uniref:Uncharacterized protein n=1 Tax=Favolaschia claudopus TaxID=2862362 RepID=A0AAW0E1W1_9AGAR